MKEYIVSQCQNPFNLDEVPESLLNITTGQMASQEVENSLKCIPEKGKAAYEDFVKERIGTEHSKSFWDPLKKETVLTFSDMKKALTNDKDRKLIIDTEVLFRRLLAVSQSRNVDLRKVLCYELAAVPPALFHEYGSMRKTAKADLTKKLEANCADVLAELPQISAIHEPTSSAYIIDGMAMIQSLDENHFTTFQDLATIVQKRLLRLFRNPSLDISSITVIFDRYDVKTSIKSSERQRRGANNMVLTYQIQGRRQVPNYRQFLKSGGNKSSLANFISQHILDNYEQLPNEKSIILAGGFGDGKLVKEVQPLRVSSIDSLQSTQEEADTRIILHTVSLSRDHSRVIVRCDDTDVLVLLIYYSSRKQLTDKVHMYAGHSGKERYIPVHEIVTQLGPTVCECLPAIHAITGCDTTCSFHRIGKRTAYSTLIKNAQALSDMKGFHEADIDTCVSLSRKFVLLMYGKKGKTWSH